MNKSRKDKIENYWGISIRGGVRHFVMKHTPWPKNSYDAEQHSKNIAERFWVADSFLDMRTEKKMLDSYIKRLGKQLK